MIQNVFTMLFIYIFFVSYRVTRSNIFVFWVIKMLLMLFIISAVQKYFIKLSLSLLYSFKLLIFIFFKGKRRKKSKKENCTNLNPILQQQDVSWFASLCQNSF